MRLRVKKVRCVETGEIFESVGAAAKYANRSISTMSRHLNGYRSRCGEYHYEFIDEEPNYNEEVESNAI